MLNSFQHSYKKSIVGGILIASVVIIICILFYLFVLHEGYSLAPQTARLEINIDGSRRVFEGEVNENMTILNALEASALAGNISFSFNINQDNKLMIGHFDGYFPGKNDKKLFFYVNYLRVEAEKIHNVPIRPGDIILVTAE